VSATAIPEGGITMEHELTGPADILPYASQRYGDDEALVTDARTLTFAELDALSDSVAARLRADGTAPGDRISLYGQNSWQWVVAYHAAFKAGAVVNPINVMLTPEEVRFVLRDCGASVLFADGDRAAQLGGVVDDVDDLRQVVAFDDPPDGVGSFDAFLSADVSGFERVPADGEAPSTIGYTSGTTGYPKGAVQSHQAVLLNCQDTARMHGRSADDVVVTALPAPHVYGNVVINSTFLAGGTVVLMRRFDPAGALAAIERHRATMFEGVPAMYSTMLASAALDSTDLSSVTRSTVGGQTIAESTVLAWEAATGGAPLIELWGMTEIAGLGTTHWVDQPTVPGSIGVALPSVEVRVASLEDVTADAPTDEPGELMVRGPLVMLEYFGNPEATAETITDDGWLHTGDVAYADADGYFYIVDRRKDMINTAGYNVYPAEIERVVADHPAVAVVAVGPVPDEVKGELACAYVVLREGASATEEEIIEHCRPYLAAYKLPRLVQFVEALPTTSTGKIMRRELSKTTPVT
jgi:long-chain acyl-CoA synthetase